MTNDQYGNVIHRLATIETLLGGFSRRLFGDDSGDEEEGELGGLKKRLKKLEEDRWRLGVAGAIAMLIINFVTGNGQLSLTQLLAALGK